MEFKKAPKVSDLSPQSRAIVVHLQQHGRSTFDQLHELFKEPAYFRSNHQNPHKPDPQWLRRRLGYMREAGHISRELHEGTMYYIAGRQVGDPVPTRQARARAPSECGVITPPRRVEVMNSPTYCPTPSTSYRDGAMDFTNCPSVEAGQARPFTPGRFHHG